MEQSEQNLGQWVLDRDGMVWNIPAWICSACACRNDNLPVRKDVTSKNIMKFSGSKVCPNCGAKMNESSFWQENARYSILKIMCQSRETRV